MSSWFSSFELMMISSLFTICHASVHMIALHMFDYIKWPYYFLRCLQFIDHFSSSSRNYFFINFCTSLKLTMLSDSQN